MTTRLDGPDSRPHEFTQAAGYKAAASRGSASSWDLAPQTRPARKPLASTLIVQYFSTRRDFRQSHVNWKKEKIFEVQREADAFLNLDEPSAPEMPTQAPTFLSTAHLRPDDFWENYLDTDTADASRLRGPCRFLETRPWQVLSCSALFINMFLLNLDMSGGAYIEEGILIFSVIELYMLVVRFRAGYGVWHEGAEARMFVCAEAFGLACNVLDKWILPYVPCTGLSPVCVHLSPFLRLLWLLRITRLIGLIPELHEIYHGVMDALQGMFWVIIFMVLLLYTCAILITRLVGQAELNEDAREIQMLFTDVGKSMMTLFNIMTAWSLDPLLPFFDANPSATPWFVLFYVFEGWVLLAVTTGVVSFRMIQSKAKLDQSEDEWLINERRLDLMQTLNEWFLALDEDANGEISRSEFYAVLHSREIMRMLELATSVGPQDLLDMFDWLDSDQSGVVSTQEFQDGFKWLTLPFNSKTFLQVRESLSKHFQDGADLLMSAVAKSLAELKEQLQSPLRKINAASEQTDMLTEAARDLAVHILPRLPQAAVTASMESEMVAMEHRLTSQIEALIARLHRIKVVAAA